MSFLSIPPKLYIFCNPTLRSASVCYAKLHKVRRESSASMRPHPESNFWTHDASMRTFSLRCTPCDAAMRRLAPPLQIGLTTQAFGLTTYPLPPPATTHLVSAGRSRRSTLRQHAVLLTPFYMRSTGSTPRIVREGLQSAKR